MRGSAYSSPTMRTDARQTGRSDPAGPLGVAGLCLLALALVWVIAEHVPAAQLRDAIALRDFTLLSRPHVDTAANLLLDLLEPALAVLWGVALACIALVRRRPRVAAAVVAVIGLAQLTSETLKPLLAHRHVAFGAVHVGPASWPSGHSTAALALALCAVLVAPARLRGAVAWLGGLFAAAVGCALLIRAWHMPSDVLGGYLVATLWMALAVAALRAAERRWPTRRRPSAAPSPGAGAGRSC
jgi:membrane-associated phospholipid phosphatase